MTNEKERTITRQGVWQAARAAAGLCMDCGRKASKGKARCKACRAIRAKNARKRRQIKKEKV